MVREGNFHPTPTSLMPVPAGDAQSLEMDCRSAGELLKGSTKELQPLQAASQLHYINTLEGGDGIQSDPDRQACANLLKFKKVRCTVLQMSQGNPKHKYSLGREWTDTNPTDKYLGVWVEENNMTQQCVLQPRERQTCSGLQQKQHDQPTSALFWWHPTWRNASCSQVPNSRRMWTCWIGSRGNHKDDKRAGAPLV